MNYLKPKMGNVLAEQTKDAPKAKKKKTKRKKKSQMMGRRG